jgi:hypothetical protein
MAFAASVVVAMFAVGLLGSPNEQQPQGGEIQFVRLKPADPEMRRLIVDGHSRSEVFRRLVEQIQRSNAVVIVQFGQCANGRFRSCVTNVDGDARQRSIRVKVNTRTTDDRLIATVAHELQHVVEILGDLNATDADSTLALYRRIGEGKCRAGLSEACETRAALDAEQQVLQELDRAPRVARAQ